MIRALCASLLTAACYMPAYVAGADDEPAERKENDSADQHGNFLRAVAIDVEDTEKQLEHLPEWIRLRVDKAVAEHLERIRDVGESQGQPKTNQFQSWVYSVGPDGRLFRLESNNPIIALPTPPNAGQAPKRVIFGNRIDVSDLTQVDDEAVELAQPKPGAKPGDESKDDQDVEDAVKDIAESFRGRWLDSLPLGGQVSGRVVVIQDGQQVLDFDINEDNLDIENLEFPEMPELSESLADAVERVRKLTRQAREARNASAEPPAQDESPAESFEGIHEKLDRLTDMLSAMDERLAALEGQVAKEGGEAGE